jgi:hypothetical protein
MSYEDSWDRPHQPGENALWQESDCYWFYDAKAGVGGYHRIGQFPNKETGQAMVFVYRAGGERFRLLQEHGADRCSREGDGQRVGSSSALALGDGTMEYAWSEADSEALLRFSEPFYTPRSWMKDEGAHDGANAVKGQMNTDGHLEVSGRLRGRMRLGAGWIELDALAHRDRSWGVRDYRSAYQHRMVTGTLGPQLSWATFIMHLENGIVAKAGFVARDGVTTDVRDVQALVEFDYDGLTVSGLRTRLLLEDGSHVDVNGTADQGFCALTDCWLVSSHHFIPLGGGGFTILDVTNRPSKGTYVPRQAELSVVCSTEGLSKAGDYAGLQWAAETPARARPSAAGPPALSA